MTILYDHIQLHHITGRYTRALVHSYWVLYEGIGLQLLGVIRGHWSTVAGCYTRALVHSCWALYEGIGPQLLGVIRGHWSTVAGCYTRALVHSVQYSYLCFKMITVYLRL